MSIFSFFKKPDYFLPAAKFNAQFAADKHARLIDVRTPGEFSQKHLPKAQNINVMASDFNTRALKLPKDKTYYLYCRSGQRSAQATKMLRKNGYTAFNLSGGMSGWGTN